MFYKLRENLAEKIAPKKPNTGDIYVADEGEQEENPNDFFGKAEDVIEQVKEMNQLDPKLFGLMQTRKLALMSLGREITGEGKEADFAREWYAGLKGVNSTIYEQMSALPVGFAVIEIIWQEKDSMYVIESLKARKQSRFLFDDKTNVLKLRTKKKTEGIKVNPLKFAVTTFQPEYSNRYGQSLYMKLYWYWFIKKKNVKFWSIFSERHAVPIVIAKEAKSMSKENKEALDAFVKKIRTAMGIKIPEGVIIEFLEAKQTGAITNYISFMGYLDSSTAIAVLGQTLTSDTGKTGSYALGKIHENVRGDILLADAVMIEETWNDQIIKPLIDLNFSDVKVYPKFAFAKGKAVDKEIMAKVIKNLRESGFDKIPESYIHSTFGIPVPVNGEPTLTLDNSPGTVKGRDQDTPPGIPPALSEIILKAEQELFKEEMRKLG